MTDHRARRREAAKEPARDAPAPPGSFANYRPIPGRPGFSADPFGHLKYDPTQDPVASKSIW